MTFPRIAMFLGIVVLLISSASAITINIEYSDEGDTPPHDENPSWDPSGLILKAHFQRAKQIWETLLPGPGEYEFDFQWDDDIGETTLGLTTDVGALDVFIEINPNFPWFADPTPNDDSEFDVSNGQTLFGQLSAPNQSTYFPGTAPPGALEVGYRGTGSVSAMSSSGVMGVNANNGNDLLSTIVHEIGHVLGISGVLGEPGEFNIYPQHVGGVVDVLVLEDEGGGHLAGHGTVPFLMCESCGQAGVRRFPTATDVLVIAEDQGITNVHLARVGRIAGGLWSEPNQWIGGVVPDMTQDVYIRHGGAVTLGTDVEVKGILITSGSSLAVQHHHLTANGILDVSGATVSVSFGGKIAADSIKGDPSALITTPGSLVRFNEFTRGTSPATSASFNGSVAIGHYIPSPGTPLPVFSPSSISTWNVAEQLAIGDENTTSTLAIPSGVSFTSTTGRIGTSSNGGTGNVDIAGFGAAWTINGTLDARHGSLNVVDRGVLTTGTVTLGASNGQMSATVNDATWTVNGSVYASRSTLTIQNGGQMTVANNLNVHDASGQVSQVEVKSGGTLDVADRIIVGAFGGVTYRDNTSSANATFDNYGGAIDNGPGGQTRFEDNASAANGIFTNHSATTAFFALGGQTVFSGSSMAGSATIANVGSTVNYSMGGQTLFFDTASADHATITNLSPGEVLAAQPARIEFFDTSTAGNATIINKPRSRVIFHDFSTAGNGTFIDETGPPGGVNGSFLFLFRDWSTAGEGTFTFGAAGGSLTFANNSTAGEANILVRGEYSKVLFAEYSSAGDATIDIGPSAMVAFNEFSQAVFQEDSTAANSTITVRGGGGSLIFQSNFIAGAIHSPTAGSANIVVLGHPGNGNQNTTAGSVSFNAFSTAGDATITAQGAPVAGFAGGTITFRGGRAGNATLIANGGPSADSGGVIRFENGGLGDSARIVVNANGSADFTQNYNTGTSVGSIEGAGRFLLGGSLLSVGNLNTDTIVSGAILDGGLYDPIGGRLTKVGTGTLTLNGTNAYSGLTTVDEGTLIVNGSIAGASVVKDGGTLKGNGTMKNVVVESGGTFAPGTSPGTITVAGLSLISGSVLEYELGAARDHILVTNNGNIELGGTLNLSILDGFNPSLGQTFQLFEGSIGSITGTFSDVNAPIFNGRTLDLDYDYVAKEVIIRVIDTILPSGDYNQDGAVSAADYTVWRDSLGSTTNLAANGNGNTVIDIGDYGVWKSNFGEASGIGSLAAVPEPATLILIIVGMLAFIARRSAVS